MANCYRLTDWWTFSEILRSILVLKLKSLTPFLHETEQVIKKLFAFFIIVQLIQLKRKERNQLIFSPKNMFDRWEMGRPLSLLNSEVVKDYGQRTRGQWIPSRQSVSNLEHRECITQQLQISSTDSLAHKDTQYHTGARTISGKCFSPRIAFSHLGGFQRYVFVSSKQMTISFHI